MDKGGSAENTLLTVAGLDKTKYAVTLVTGLSLESNMSFREWRDVEKSLAEARRQGSSIVTIRELVRRIHPVYDVLAVIKLMALFIRERPRIVHTHTSKTGILGRWSAFLADIPIIVHTPHGHVFWGYFGKWKTRLFILAEKITALITDKIIMLTDREKQDHCARGIAHPDKFEVIHSGIDVSRFTTTTNSASDIKTDLKIPEDNLIVGTIGRLTEIKGQEYLIRAARKVVRNNPKTTFILVGDGELREQLETMVEAMGLREHVRFLGWHNDVAAVMSIMDVFVLPSLNEGMGRVLAEAMASGKPIIASDIGGIPDLVSDRDNGYLVPPGDSDALALKLVHLLNDKSLRERMGNAGRKRAGRYSAEVMVKHIDALYQKLLQQKKSITG